VDLGYAYCCRILQRFGSISHLVAGAGVPALMHAHQCCRQAAHRTFALRGPLERREHTPRRPRGACMALLHIEFFLRDVIGPYKTVNVIVSYTLVLCSTCASPFSDSICATTFFVNGAPIATGYNSQECRILQLQKSRQSKSGSGTCVTTQVWCPRCGVMSYELSPLPAAVLSTL
jgi:hypothetical protein